MIKEHKSILTKIEISFDFVVLFASSFITNALIIFLSSNPDAKNYVVIPNINSESYYYLIIAIYAFLTIIFFFFDNAYLYYRFKPKRKLLKQITTGVARSSLIIFILLILFDNKEVPIIYFTKFALVSALTFTLYRLIILKLFTALREYGYMVKHIVILYSDKKTEDDFINLIGENRNWGLNVLKEIDVTHKNGYDQFFTLLKSYAVDDVFIFSDNNSILPGKDYINYIDLANEFGKNIRFLFKSNSIFTKTKPVVSFVDKYPTLLFTQKNIIENHAATKRTVDILAGLVGSLITLLLLIVIGPIIKLSSKGPIFFKQLRVGSNGRNFYIYKFRTMCNDAEDKKADLQEHNELTGAVFKMKNDPRVTKIGNFLRSTSLDEFPQFFNVLFGEMSLIGTRPPTPAEVKEYKNWQHKRITIKPGITGLWQVSGRNSITDFDQIAKLDIEYIENWSIWLDIKIFLKTFSALFKGQ